MTASDHRRPGPEVCSPRRSGRPDRRPPRAGRRGPAPAANDPGPDPRLAAAGATRRSGRARRAGIADSPPDLCRLRRPRPRRCGRRRRRAPPAHRPHRRHRPAHGRPRPADRPGPELAGVPAALTLTVGIGPRVVAGVGAPAPAWLAPLPPFTVDRLEERWSGTDLLLQVCANSPTTVAHAQRRLLTGLARSPRCAGCSAASRTARGPGLPMRNLFGQVGGPCSRTSTGSTRHSVVRRGPAGLAARGQRAGAAPDPDEPRHLGPGRPVVEENAIGRRLDTGAPVTAPRVPMRWPRRTSTPRTPGVPRHRRRRPPATGPCAGPHERFLRRPYSYDDPPAPGELSDSGLLFAAFAGRPGAPVRAQQRRLAEKGPAQHLDHPGRVGGLRHPARRARGEILGEALLA